MKHYHILSELFKYPSERVLPDCHAAGLMVQKKYASEASKLLYYQKFLEKHSLPEIQEYYVKTFDIQALCHLDVGYILFGEDLKRGEFLVKIQDEQIKYNQELGTELPDHLTNVLSLLANTPDREFAEEFVQYILLPAILGMLKGFKDEHNIYYYLLQLLKEILVIDFEIEEINLIIPDNNECVFAGNGCAVNNVENY